MSAAFADFKPLKPPGPKLVAAVAIGAALTAGADDFAAMLRERARARLERGANDSETDLQRNAAALLWPDPLEDADLRGLDATMRRGIPALALSEAQAASAAAPRRGSLHLIAAMLAAEAGRGHVGTVRRELARAAKSDPFHGELQAAIAREQLVGAVLARSAAQLWDATRSFAAAVQVGALPCEEAYLALSAGDAPRELLQRVAGRDPARLEKLVEHLARALDREGAFAVADELDRIEGNLDPSGDRESRDRRGRALACRRLGGSLLAAGLARDAVDVLEEAARRSPDPDALALDRADALLQSAATSEGIELLARALAKGHADAARAAGAIHCASDPEAAKLALYELGRVNSGPALRALVAEVLVLLGDRARSVELIAEAPPSPGARRAPRD